MSEEELLDAPKDTVFINIRKLAALDIVLHGPTFILIEFGLGVFFCGVFGLISLFVFFRTPTHPLFSGLIGLVLAWIALNYVPLLLHAISLARRNSAEQEIAFELLHKDKYARKYTIQSLLLILPLFVPVLAIYQELQKRSHR